LTAWGYTTNYASDDYNFVPNGSKVTKIRDVVSTAACNKCHDQIAEHGGSRRGMALCRSMVALYPGTLPRMAEGGATGAVLLFAVTLATLSAAFFGVLPEIVGPTGAVLEGACEGNLVIADSWPGQARTVFGDHGRFVKTYFAAYPGKYFTGDGCRRDEDGYYWITGRVDDVINVSGHRMGTAEVESALVAHPKVSEAAVVGYPHDIKGQGIYAYVTLMSGVEPSEALRKELVGWVRKEIGPIASPDLIQFAPGLPKPQRNIRFCWRLKHLAGHRDDRQVAIPHDWVRSAADVDRPGRVVHDGQDSALAVGGLVGEEVPPEERNFAIREIFLLDRKHNTQRLHPALRHFPGRSVRLRAVGRHAAQPLATEWSGRPLALRFLVRLDRSGCCQICRPGKGSADRCPHRASPAPTRDRRQTGFPILRP